MVRPGEMLQFHQSAKSTPIRSFKFNNKTRVVWGINSKPNFSIPVVRVNPNEFVGIGDVGVDGFQGRVPH